MIKKIISSIFVLIIFIFSISPAKAAWSDPKTISSGAGNTIMPSITTDSKGYLHAVWMELTPGDENFWSGIENPGIFYSKWNGDAWSTPLKISQNTNKWAGLPAIAADSQNRIHVVWDEATDDRNGQIIYSMYDGASWSTPATISTTTNGTKKANWSARISVDTSDIVHVIYNFANYNLRPSANEYYYTSKNGTWSSSEKISENFVNAQHATLITGPGTTVNVVLWAGGGVWFKKNSGSGWTQSVRISPAVNEDAQYPKMIIDGTGKLHVVWTAIIYIPATDTWLNSTRYASSTDGGASWSSPTTLNTNNIEWTYWGVPLLGLTKDSKNNIYAGWGEKNAVSGVDVKYRKWNGTSWENAVFLRNVTEADSPYLYQDIWDNQHFIWTEKNQGTGKWEIWYSILPTYWATIDNGGGSLIVNPNNVTMVTLTVPSGALVSSTAISAAIGPLPESANPNYVTVPRSYYFGPSGQTFSKNYTTVYTYTAEELAGGDPQQLGAYVWNGQTNAWNYLTGTVNTTAKTLTIKANHFSLFGMMTPRVNTTFLSPSEKDDNVTRGSTIPVRFKLNYATDNSPVLPPNIELAVKNNQDQVIATYFMDKGDEGVRFDKGNNQYIINVHTGKIGMNEGEYQLVARIAEVEVGSKTISVTR